MCGCKGRLGDDHLILRGGGLALFDNKYSDQRNAEIIFMSSSEQKISNLTFTLPLPLQIREKVPISKKFSARFAHNSKTLKYLLQAGFTCIKF